MSKFKVGDKVVCIDSVPMSGLYKGNIYTVRDIYNIETLLIEELGVSYSAHRFELADVAAAGTLEEQPQKKDIPKLSISVTGEVAHVEITGSISPEKIHRIIDVIYKEPVDLSAALLKFRG